LTVVFTQNKRWITTAIINKVNRVNQNGMCMSCDITKAATTVRRTSTMAKLNTLRACAPSLGLPNISRYLHWDMNIYYKWTVLSW
jgi:hypothetical protein